MVFHLNLSPTLIFFLLAEALYYCHISVNSTIMQKHCSEVAQRFIKEKIEPVSLAALDPALSFQKLILHCITAIYKSLKYLAIITAKNEADNRVDSTVCGRYITDDNYVQNKNFMETR